MTDDLDVYLLQSIIIDKFYPHKSIIISTRKSLLTFLMIMFPLLSVHTSTLRYYKITTYIQIEPRSAWPLRKIFQNVEENLNGSTAQYYKITWLHSNSATVGMTT